MNPHLAHLAPRIAELEMHFAAIAQTRMAGMPVLNAALRVEAVGFEPVAGGDEAAADTAVGILITPWFMNLVRLPLERDGRMCGVGRSERHALGREVFDFIGAHEPGLGAFSACSLFSPMFEFADQATARATALAVLRALRGAPVPAAAMAARRSFLFGRSVARGALP